MLDGKAMAVLASGVIECATFETSVMKLTIGSVLIDVVAVRLAAADGFEFAQR